MKLPMDSSIQAEYENGFILDETELNDVSPYNTQQNVFRAILDKSPEVINGKLVRFSVFWKDQRYDVDWTKLPDNARPIRFRHGYFHQTGPNAGEAGWSGVDFGYQWNDEDGSNKKHVEELR